MMVKDLIPELPIRNNKIFFKNKSKGSKTFK